MKRFLEFFCAILLSSFLVLMSLATQASATVTFFTNEASFYAQVLSSTLIDFEVYSFGYHSTFVDRVVTFKSDVTVLQLLSVSGFSLSSTLLAKAGT
ncbi:MAG: hypothetical protein H8E41_07300, partial [Desulfobulbaceae bacterium]|nr:hypothetical protein [Candidatus Desulfobia pelagia]